MYRSIAVIDLVGVATFAASGVLAFDTMGERVSAIPAAVIRAMTPDWMNLIVVFMMVFLFCCFVCSWLQSGLFPLLSLDSPYFVDCGSIYIMRRANLPDSPFGRLQFQVFDRSHSTH